MKTSCLSLLLPPLTTGFTPTPHTRSQSTTALHSTISQSQIPEWDTKQHLYGLDLIDEETITSVTIGSDGEIAGKDGALPLPETYITCGRCKCLFAIAEDDLGSKGKGW